jgi:hypothetical protein
MAAAADVEGVSPSRPLRAVQIAADSDGIPPAGVGRMGSTDRDPFCNDYEPVPREEIDCHEI